MLSVSSDYHNIYVHREGKIHSSDVGIPVLGHVPFAIKKFEKLEGKYYFLDLESRVWCNSVVVGVGVRDFNERFILYLDGRAVRRLKNSVVDIDIPVAKLIHDLLLDVEGNLYDSEGQHLLSHVIEAHTDGNEIIAVKRDGTVEYVGDYTDNELGLETILRAGGVKKAVVSDGTVLLLSHQGQLIGSGANRHYECGIDMGVVVDWIQYLDFPYQVVDFDFRWGVGWALLNNGEVWVWGQNREEELKFLQWEKEEFVSVRKLVV
jgi:hypothetical protein